MNRGLKPSSDGDKIYLPLIGFFMSQKVVPNIIVIASNDEKIKHCRMESKKPCYCPNAEAYPWYRRKLTFQASLSGRQKKEVRFYTN